jgi:hypothetical protein
MTNEERRINFEALVLQGIWIVIWMMCQLRRRGGGPGSGYDGEAPTWRGNAVSYLDLRHEARAGVA